MTQPNAAAVKSRVAAPYQIPDYEKGMTLPDEITVLYSRLSRDDREKEKEDDSNSIQNQKKILGKYAAENNLPSPVFFTDDGISGTTFERSGFQAAIALVEAGKVKNFVVKDMSRFGRDYIQVGLYTEVMFPEADVRFIALNDNVDSEKGENDLTPFRNLFNEWYARDTSKKIRAVFRAKGMAGEHLSVTPPYGYRKDPNNPKLWITDPEPAEIVRKIFRWCMDGLGPTHIANRLKSMRVEIPTVYAYNAGFRNMGEPPIDIHGWEDSTVARILSRREYLGHTINFKTYRRSYKNRTMQYNDPSEHAVFENTHEAIIDQETFDRVQQIREGRRRVNGSGRVGLFSGLTYCADCGSKMYLSSGSCLKPEQDNYTCSGFRTKKRACESAHFIRRVVLERLVLEQIQHVTSFAAEYEDKFVELLKQDGADKSRKELLAGKRKLTQGENRIAELDYIIQRLYEDSVSGKLTDARFIKLSQGYETEQQTLQAQVTELAELISTQEQKSLDLNRFLARIRKYAHVDELTPTLLNELVERIEIHAPDKSSGKRVQPIDVYFNYVGLIGKLTFEKASKPETASHAEIGSD